MTISREVYSCILSLPATNIESAYLLGSSEPNVINVLENTSVCNGIGGKTNFIPNVNVWNNLIEDWESKGIDFIGILHTHYYNVEELSDGDIQYIEKIVSCTQNKPCKLYFPILVFPDRKLVLYSAKERLGKSLINKEDYCIKEVKSNEKTGS